jgi:hypothetical protein
VKTSDFGRCQRFQAISTGSLFGASEKSESPFRQDPKAIKKFHGMAAIDLEKIIDVEIFRDVIERQQKHCLTNSD